MDVIILWPSSRPKKVSVIQCNSPILILGNSETCEKRRRFQYNNGERT